VTVEEFRLPARIPPPSRTRTPLEAPDWLVEAARVREGRADGRRAAPALAVTPERWQVIDAAGRAVDTAGETQAHQLARARGAVAVPAGDLVTLTDL
jgi:hypothetical protein